MPEILATEKEKRTIYKMKFEKLGNIVKSSKGKKPINLSSEKIGEFTIPYVDIKAFEKKVFRNYTDGVKCNLCEIDDVLIVWDGARCGLVGRGVKGAIGSTLAKMESKLLVKSYLYYFLQSIFSKINTNPKGVGIPHIDPTILWDSELVVPPLHEQNRIVQKIEELFSELDYAINTLKTTQQQLQTYRQSVLKHAFEGHFTGGMDSWIIAGLGTLISKIEAGKSFRCDERPPLENETGVLKVSAVTWGEYKEVESKTVLEKSKINDNYLVKPNDFLFTRANTIELVGACVIVKNTSKSLMLSDKTLRIVFNDRINPTYALYYLKSKKGRNEIERLSTGNQDSMRNIGQGRIMQIQIPICDIEIQTKVIKEIETRLSESDYLLKTIDQQLLHAESLRQSILQRAFSGELLKDEVVYKPKDVYLYQAQLLGCLNKISNKNKVRHGEMTIAKYAYLLDRIYGIPTLYNFKRWHLGPYAPEMKKALKNKDFFTTSNGSITLTDADTLLSADNPYLSKVEAAANDLCLIFSKYPLADRHAKTELLATVCKVIEDIQSIDLAEIRRSMKEWKIDLSDKLYKNKAEKFSESDTSKCIAFIKNKEWDKKLIRSND